MENSIKRMFFFLLKPSLTNLIVSSILDTKDTSFKAPCYADVSVDRNSNISWKISRWLANNNINLSTNNKQDSSARFVLTPSVLASNVQGIGNFRQSVLWRSKNRIFFGGFLGVNYWLPRCSTCLQEISGTFPRSVTTGYISFNIKLNLIRLLPG